MAASWRTSASGLTLAVGLILGVVLPKFGVFSESEINDIISAAMILVGVLGLGLSARDDKVSSEGRVAPKALKILLFALLFVPLMPGCASHRIGGSREVTEGRYFSDGSVNNYLRTSPTEGATAEYAAEPPSAVIGNRDGVENYSGTPFGSVSAMLPNEVSLLASIPSDFTAEEVSIAADGSATLRGVVISNSAVTIARASFVTAMVPIIESWTREQKEAELARYEMLAKTGDVLAQAIVPLIKSSLGVP